MRRISYAGESFITTDGVADALLRLVAALGANHTAAAIEVPAFVMRRFRGAEVGGGSVSGGGAGSGDGGSVSGGSAIVAARTVPARAEQPLIEIVRLVAGPSSEMISRHHEGDEMAEVAEFSPDAEAAIARFNARTESLGVPHAVVRAQPHGKVEFDFDGLESL